MSRITVRATTRPGRRDDRFRVSEPDVVHVVDVIVAGVIFRTDCETAMGAQHIAYLTAAALGVGTERT